MIRVNAPKKRLTKWLDGPAAFHRRGRLFSESAKRQYMEEFANVVERGKRHSIYGTPIGLIGVTHARKGDGGRLNELHALIGKADFQAAKNEVMENGRRAKRAEKIFRFRKSPAGKALRLAVANPKVTARYVRLLARSAARRMRRGARAQKEETQ